MSKTKFYTNLSLLAVFFSISNVTFAEGKENLPSYNLEEDAKNLYLKSFFYKKEEQLAEETFEEEENREKSWNLKPLPLNDRDIRSLVISNIVDFEKNWPSSKNVYSKYLIGDCDIFFGKNKDPKFNLISKINRTKTVVGEVTLATLLTRPTTNIQDLLKRQQTIQILIDFKKKNDVFDKVLNTYKDIENSVTSLFSSRDPFYNAIVKQKIQDTFLFDNKSLNTITILGHNKILKKDLLGIFMRSLWYDVGLCAMFSILSAEKYIIFPPLFHLMTNIILNDKTYALILSQTLMAGINILNIYSGNKKFIENDKILRGIAHRLYDVSILIRLSKKLTDIIESNKHLKSVLGDKIIGMKTLLQKINDNKNLKLIVKSLLEKHEMFRNFNYFTSNAGYLLFAYDNLDLIKDNIKDAIADLGLLDAYCSCADLFTENINKTNHFVFAKYIPREQSKTPYIKFDNLWNPFLDPEVAVSNKAEMGVNSSTQCTNMIITGPNAGGKSTYVNSVLIAIVMGQTIGFAPGTEILFTPFNKINSYIETRDDIAAGKSAFIAEVDRSFYHYEILKNLKENEFSFSVFDEPFRGTNPMEGSSVEYSIFEKIGGFKNNLSILTTHYPIMTLLEDNNFNLGFRNYKVYIKKDENDKILFTYKIIPGRSKQSIAIDLLYQTGYKNEILKNAREIVRNPKLYETKFEDNKVSQGKW